MSCLVDLFAMDVKSASSRSFRVSTAANFVPKVSAATMKRRKREQGFSAKAAKQKWDALEKTVSLAPGGGGGWGGWS